MESVVVYADIIIIVGIIVSIPALWGVCRAYNFRFVILRTVLAALLCGSGTVCLICIRPGVPIYIASSIAIYCAMIFIAFGRMKFRLFVHSSIMLTAENVFLAGLCETIINLSGSENGYIGIVGIIAGTATLALTVRLRKSAYRISLEASSVNTVRLTLTVSGKTVELDATLDTGNLLVEPISLCPVILLNPEYSSFVSGSEKTPRAVPYRTAFGCGIVKCVMPDNALLNVNGKTENAGNVYVGISDNISCDALVGAEIIKKSV